MSEDPTEETERSFARCTRCGTESAALVDGSGTVTTPHGECRECGGDEFEEIGEADLEELEATDWTE
jgi:hypothetical protein